MTISPPSGFLDRKGGKREDGEDEFERGIKMGKRRERTKEGFDLRKSERNQQV